MYHAVIFSASPRLAINFRSFYYLSGATKWSVWLFG
jgi:hypothetical protein